MRILSITAKIGLIVLGATLLGLVADPALWGEGTPVTLTTTDLAFALLGEWAIGLLLLGCLMAMAMVGAAYLVRDERKENLEWELSMDEGGDAS